MVLPFFGGQHRLLVPEFLSQVTIHRLWGVFLWVIEDANLKNNIFECDEERWAEFENMETKA